MDDALERAAKAFCHLHHLRFGGGCGGDSCQSAGACAGWEWWSDYAKAAIRAYLEHAPVVEVDSHGSLLTGHADDGTYRLVKELES